MPDVRFQIAYPWREGSCNDRANCLVNELNPDGSSADKLEAIWANKDNTGPQAPDVVDIGLSFGPVAKAEGLIQNYKVATCDTIPDSAMDADGAFYGDDYGVLSFIVNTDLVKNVPADWADLIKPQYATSVRLVGRSAFRQPGADVDHFSRYGCWRQAGRLIGHQGSGILCRSGQGWQLRPGFGQDLHHCARHHADCRGLPTVVWVQLKLPKLRPVMECITLLPLVIPPIVIAFGFIRLYNTALWLPRMGSAAGSDILLMFGYSVLALPYMYRAVDTGQCQRNSGERESIQNGRQLPPQREHCAHARPCGRDHSIEKQAKIIPTPLENALISGTLNWVIRKLRGRNLSFQAFRTLICRSPILPLAKSIGPSVACRGQVRENPAPSWCRRSNRPGKLSGARTVLTTEL